MRSSSLEARRVCVQHHHAHIASCMADQGLEDGKRIGLCFDGTGYDTDGTLWGGEVLLASYSDFERFAHLEVLPLPGGEYAGRTPWRTAYGYARALGLQVDDLPFLGHVNSQALLALQQQLDTGQDLPKTSSINSLFEAVAGLTGIRNTTTYESQAVMEMEVLARPFVSSVKSYPFTIQPDGTENILQLRDLLAAIIQDVRNGRTTEIIAARFHKTIVEMAVESVRLGGCGSCTPCARPVDRCPDCA